ncbi:MAG: adenylate/guanylate cyclase domain-containing protein [Rhodospirillaceae bacterium]|nr:adenylate/guanylate cyclase domain-containing protein [Rhodospirillaceae bacterium]
MLHNGRWEIHSNFTMDQRDESIDEAKRIDVSGQFGAVCVVREVYSAADNSSRESVIYHSPKLSAAPPVDVVISGQGGFVSEGKRGPTQAEQRAAAEGAKKESGPKSKQPKRAAAAAPANRGGGKSTKEPNAAPSAPAAANASSAPAAASASDAPAATNASNESSEPKQDIPLSAIMPQLSVILILSMLAAGALSYVVYYVLQYAADIGIAIHFDVARGLLVAVFVISFLSFFIPRARKLLRGLSGSKGRARPSAAAAPIVAPASVTATTPEGLAPISQTPEPMTAVDPAMVETTEATVEGDVDEPLFAEQLAPEVSGEVPEGALAGDGEVVETESSIQDASDPYGDEPGFIAPPSRAANELSGELLKFVHDSLEPVARSNHELNAFNRFGMTLYLAGAADYLGMQHRVPENELTEVLSSQMQLLGQSAALARGFCANIDEYLIDPRNQEMYQAGRATIASHLGNDGAEIPLDKVLDDWNRPRQKEDANVKEFVAVLFTDIVGSTALTQARGDDAAQLVVHAHDRIVRQAIGQHGGREIKHTGDGIMATFPQITDSIVASQAIQKSCYYENQSNSELGLGICIGINAGEPIHENNDIFGTPVQMAARVLSKAEGWEIAVSSSVREMCSGKNFDFEKKGDYELKGFDDLVPIYLCEWRTDAEQEAIDEPEAEDATNALNVPDGEAATS